jgi:hypothetical protein
MAAYRTRFEEQNTFYRDGNLSVHYPKQEVEHKGEEES